MNYYYCRIYLDNSCSIAIGKVIKHKIGGKVDASFVEVTNSSYTPSRIVYYSNSSGSTSGGHTLCTDYLYLWMTGVKVYKAGSTTYLTTGELIDYNYSTVLGYDLDNDGVDESEIQIKNMYRAKIKVRSGDSGGALYCKDEGDYCALGVTCCASTNYAAFIKWQNIDDKFEIYFY